MVRIVANDQAAGLSHAVLGTPIVPPFPADARCLVVGMGCFWGAEKCFWQRPEVVTTAVGYAGGKTKNPTYREVCAGTTGHAEVVLVVYRYSGPEVLRNLLDVFWENHDPTQGMRQGNDIGSQYRSVIYLDDPDDRRTAIDSRDNYQSALTAAGLGAITTEIGSGVSFYYAEDYHQQYLAKNPAGYCGLGGTGVRAV